MAPPFPLPRASYASVEDPQTCAQASVLPASPPPDDGIEKVAVIGTHGNSFRAEIRLTLPNGMRRGVHFYEVYWAPLTEGKVTIRDVSWFLLNAGRLGIWNTWQGQFFE